MFCDRLGTHLSECVMREINFSHWIRHHSLYGHWETPHHSLSVAMTSLSLVLFGVGLPPVRHWAGVFYVGPAVGEWWIPLPSQHPTPDQESYYQRQTPEFGGMAAQCLPCNGS